MRKPFYLLPVLFLLSAFLYFQLAGCSETVRQDETLEDTATEKAIEDSAEEEQEEPEATEEKVKILKSPDTDKFNEYFSDIGLGKLAADADLLQDMEPDVTTFLPDEKICLHGTLKKSAIIGIAIYNPETSSYESERQDIPQTLEKGDFSSCGPIAFGSGSYEYKVYIGDTLVAVLPFEVE